MFRVYNWPIIINEIHFTEIWIDPHYEAKHAKSINDDLILNLVTELNGIILNPSLESNGFQYFEVDLEFKNKLYRLILVIPASHQYIGIRNAYRRAK